MSLKCDKCGMVGICAECQEEIFIAPGQCRYDGCKKSKATGKGYCEQHLDPKCKECGEKYPGPICTRCFLQGPPKTKQCETCTNEYVGVAKQCDRCKHLSDMPIDQCVYDGCTDTKVEGYEYCAKHRCKGMDDGVPCDEEIEYGDYCYAHKIPAARCQQVVQPTWCMSDAVWYELDADERGEFKCDHHSNPKNLRYMLVLEGDVKQIESLVVEKCATAIFENIDVILKTLGLRRKDAL